jgi:hypothetical protein
MAAAADLAERYAFFREHAGYIVGRRAECALQLARAERLLERAQDLGAASVEWVDDDEPYETDDAAVLRGLESGRFVGLAGCVVRCGDAVASLWGIVVEAPSAVRDDPYLRVVAAELASELEDELQRAVV